MVLIVLLTLLTAIPLPAGVELESLTLTGRLLRSDGSPAAGARVLFIPDREAQQLLGLRGALGEALGQASLGQPPLDQLPLAVADAEGRIRITGPWFGPALIGTGWGDDLARPQVWVLAEGCVVTRLDGVLPRGSEHDLGERRLEPGASVTGRVLGPDGGPRPGVVIQARPLRQDGLGAHLGPGQGLLVTDSDGEGRFRLSGLPAGQAVLSLDSGEEPWLAAGPFEVVAGEISEVGALVLRSGRVLRGRVVGPDGEPVVGARVHALPEEPWRVSRADDLAWDLHHASRSWVRARHAVSGPDGRFTLRGLPEGRPWLVAEAQGLAPVALAPDGWSEDGRAPELTLEALAELAVAVVDASGAVVPGADVVAYRLDGLELADGAECLPDRGPAEVTAPRGGLLQGRRFGPVGPFGTGLLVRAPGLGWTDMFVPGAASGTHQQQVVTLEPGCRIGGTVLDQDGRPFPGAVIVAEAWRRSLDEPFDSLPPWMDSSDGPVWRRTWTDDQGRFELADLQQGTWKVTVAAREAADTGGGEFELTEAGQEWACDAVLTRGGTVRGRLDIPGAGLAGHDVLLRPEPGTGRSPGRSEGTTDGRGTFVIEGVPEGAWRLTTDVGGELTLDVTAGSVTEVELTIDPETRLAFLDAAARRRQGLEERRREQEEQRARSELDQRAAFARSVAAPGVMTFDPTLFPSAEPFGNSAMLDLLLGDPSERQGLEERLAYVVALNQEWAALGEGELAFFGEQPPEPGSAAAEVAAEQRHDLRLGQLPFVIQTLADCWSLESWDDTRVRLAREVSRYAAGLDHALEPPKLTFAPGEDEANDQALRRLAAWYRRLVRQPPVYARLLSLVEMMEDGPHAPEPADLPADLDPAAEPRLAVGDRLVLLLRPDPSTPRAPLLIGVVDGTPSWCVAMQHTGERLAFQDRVEDLGPHGWRVTLSFGEACTLYLDQAGRLLFYFTSW